ncbi:MAG: nitroreductase family protein [Syntrophobacter sp.]
MIAFIDPVEKLIRKRRSIRKYKPDMPPSGWIDAAVSCAAMAPSPSNSQPVRFVRIRSEKMLERLQLGMEARRRELLEILEAKKGTKRTRNLINAYYRYSEFLFNAPVIIAAGTLQTETFTGKLMEAGVLAEDARGETDRDITVGLALKGLLLKSEALGLGTCILTAPLAFLPEVEKTLGLNDIRIKCFVTMGFPDETPAPIDKKGPSEIYTEI